MKNKEQIERFKQMPKKSQLKIFINDRFSHLNNKVIRFISYKYDCILFEVKIDKMAFTSNNFRLFDVNVNNKKAVYSIDNNIYSMGSIINEINFFRRFPEKEKKRNFTVI